MCEPTTLMMIGLAASVGSSVMGAIGQIQQAKAQNEAYQYNAKIDRLNAKIADRKAKDALERGKLEEQRQRAQNAQLQGEQQAAMAANGVDLTFGSPLDVMIGSAMEGEIDALTLRANAAREERDYRQQAVNYLENSKFNKRAGKSALTAGYLGAAGTVLGGVANAGMRAGQSGVFA